MYKPAVFLYVDWSFEIFFQTTFADLLMMILTLALAGAPLWKNGNWVKSNAESVEHFLLLYSPLLQFEHYLLKVYKFKNLDHLMDHPLE